MGGGWQGASPTIDVTDTEKEIVVTAELPLLASGGWLAQRRSDARWT